MRWRFLVGAMEQIYCGDAAQCLGSFAQDRRIGARAGYQADLKSDLSKRVLRAQRSKRVSGGKGYLEFPAPGFQTGKQLGRIGRDRITGALDEHGVGRQREAVI